MALGLAMRRRARGDVDDWPPRTLIPAAPAFVRTHSAHEVEVDHPPPIVGARSATGTQHHTRLLTGIVEAAQARGEPGHEGEGILVGG